MNDFPGDGKPEHFQIPEIPTLGVVKEGQSLEEVMAGLDADTLMPGPHVLDRDKAELSWELPDGTQRVMIRDSSGVTRTVDVAPTGEVTQPVLCVDGRAPRGTYDAPEVDAGLVKKETDPSEIDRQIAEGLEATGGNVFQFVNNFETRLPGGLRWQEVERDYDVLDKPLLGREPDALDGVYHSERYLNGTMREMLEDVEHVIRSGDGVDPQRLTALRDTYVESPASSREANRNEYLLYALPVYRGLRVMGYSHYDLWH